MGGAFGQNGLLPRRGEIKAVVGAGLSQLGWRFEDGFPKDVTVELKSEGQ